MPSGSKRRTPAGHLPGGWLCHELAEQLGRRRAREVASALGGGAGTAARGQGANVGGAAAAAQARGICTVAQRWRSERERGGGARELCGPFNV